MAFIRKNSKNGASPPCKRWLLLKELAPPALTPKRAGNASRRWSVSFGARTKLCRRFATLCISRQENATGALVKGLAQWIAGGAEALNLERDVVIGAHCRGEDTTRLLV